MAQRDLPLIAKSTTMQEAARILSAAAFRVWLLLHFEPNLTLGRTILARRHGTSKASFDRALLELRRNAYLTIESGKGKEPCVIQLTRVLDVSGRSAIRKHASLTTM